MYIYFSELYKEYMWNDKQKSQLKKSLSKIEHIMILFIFVLYLTIFANWHPFASLRESRCLEGKCWQDYIGVPAYVDMYELEKLTGRSNQEKSDF